MNLYAEHPALHGLNIEQLAELALYGLRYRALGAADIDFSDPSRLDVYWTGERMVKKTVKNAVKASKAGDLLALKREGEAIGHLQALFNCSVIDHETYKAQYQLLLEQPR
ncbi:hypothetical protein KDX38_27190 [Pseudomonas sp. CDFA 602]|uniref:hypothetical protein n=1 Tax=Pseudomonas californiensis TaxID=2829823 RepID=UPI001E52E654|nr:hypothetical protein [Pseudomonas californiensis]MCD5997266.1 hypothetical protein [Pseudomonas californiensis]MCD6002854.1 hypothetical protein [Pseudomonas californiensis]